MSTTIGRRWSSTAPRGDFACSCDICGVVWRRSQLVKDADGNLSCPNDAKGRVVSELDRGNAQGAQAYARGRSRPQSGKIDTDDGSDTPTQRTTLDGIYS